MEQVFKRKSIFFGLINPKIIDTSGRCHPKESFQHMSHVSIKSGDIIIHQQETPGDCILCDEKFYSHYFAHIEDHYHRRHYSKVLKIYDHMILCCKCKTFSTGDWTIIKGTVTGIVQNATSLSMTGSSMPSI